MDSTSLSHRWIAKEYFDLNGTHLHILDEPPSALQFLQLVHISRPVLIKGFQLPALAKWTDEYIVELMGERSVTVAVTPDGRADAVSIGADRKEYFVEPFVEKMTMSDFLGCLSSDSASEAYYLQSQNGNMYSCDIDSGNFLDSEFEPLRPDVPSEIPWCSRAFGHRPEAVNIWIGNSRSVTSIHSDPYENIYTVVRGAKHFTLLPPTEGWCLRERVYPHATYTRASSASALTLTPSPPTVPPVSWSSVRNPDISGSLPPEAHPIHITVHAGCTLYLPVGWWHYVSQSEETTIALNWWYDTESRGMNWVWLNFLRGIRDCPSEGDSEGKGGNGNSVFS